MEEEKENIIDDNVYDSFYRKENITKYFLDQHPPKENKKFTDDIFPPNDFSLLSKKKTGAFIDKDNGAKNASLINFNEIEWKRLSEIFPSNVLYEDNIDLEDIAHGKIGTCYFLSALAAMTQFPHLISQIFKTKQQNDQCYWEIVLFLNGEFQIVVIDDYIPVVKGTNNLYFSKPKRKELWVVLLEKAWAKINGGYANIISGWPSDVLNCFTGYSVSNIVHENINLQSMNEVFNKVDIFSKKNCIICSSTRGDEDEIERFGLIKGHIYSVVSTAHLKTNGNNELKLIKLKNPWGYCEWKGDYCNGSAKWNDIPHEDKDKLGLSNKEDSGFYISIKDYMKYFIRTDICHLIFDCNLKIEKISKEDIKHPNVFNLFIPNDNTDISLSLIKENWRYKREFSSSQFPTTLILMRVNQESLNTSPFVDFYADYNSCEDCNIIIPSLSKGIYVLFTYISYDNCTGLKPNEYFVKISSNTDFTIQKVNSSGDPFQLLCKMFICGIKQNLNLKENEITYDLGNNFMSSGIGYLIVINPLSDGYQIWSNNTKEIINMFMLPPYANKKEFTFNVYPNSEVICLAMKNETYGTYWFNLKSSMKKYKSSKLIRLPNEKAFDVNEWVPMLKAPQISDFKYDYKSISLENAKKRKIFTKEEINNLMIEELKKKEPKIMELILTLTPLNEEEIDDSNLVWVFIQKQNGFYIGQVLDNFKEENSKVVRFGRGAFKYTDDNNTFVGYWKNNQKEKEGKVYDVNYDIVLEGNYEKGMKNGKGKQKFANGDRYKGMFKNDAREGEGIYYWKDGSRWEGVFANNVMNGIGIYYGNDGDTFEAKYENGEYIEIV